MKRLIGAIAVLAGMVTVTVASAQTNEEFSLAVKTERTVRSKVEVCTLIRTAKPFEIMLRDGKAKTVVSGTLGHQNKSVFPLKLEIQQGNNEVWIFDKLVYELKLGVTATGPVIVESSNHPAGYDREISLTVGRCPRDDEYSQ